LHDSFSYLTPPAKPVPVTRLVCLTGFMGSGKTTVGTLLARQLAWRFEDLDTRIEEYAGLSVTAIFDRFGEDGFRKMETEQLDAALGRATESREPFVLALGGGTYAQPGVVERLRAAGAVVIWLDCPAELLLARCATMTNRPLFRDTPGFHSLLEVRLHYYEKADHRVAGGDEAPKVVERILALPPFGRLPGVAEECSAHRVKP
jgi:shikimate kinase